MIRYLDTSLLVPLFVKEPKSQAILTWFAGIGATDVVVSEWAITEFSSAIAIKTRTGQIGASIRMSIQADFLEFVRSRAQHVTVTSLDFQRAARLCDRWQSGLRAGDALHLAIAEQRGLTVCTLDQGMLTAALNMGMATETV